MINFDDKYFRDFKFTKAQIRNNFDNAQKDLKIVNVDKIAEVKFTYTYTAFIKGGIALLSFYNKKVKSAPGHHAKIIEMMSNILNDETIEIMGSAMRSKRNMDFYDGGIEITEKESVQYLDFVKAVLPKVENIIF
jgi:hypothetical protein